MKSKEIFLQNTIKALVSGCCKLTNFSDGSMENIHQFFGAPEFVRPSFDEVPTSHLDQLANSSTSGCRKDCHGVRMLQAITIRSIIYKLISTRSFAVNYVQEAIQGTKTAIAYVYCDYENPKTHSELELLSSIARQLTEQTNSILPAVKEFCGKNVERRRNPTGDEWISLIKSICLLFQTTYVFVDALVIFLYPISRFNEFQSH